MTPTESEGSFVFSDLSLSQRLERTESVSCAEFVEARARAFPDSGACWRDFGGTFAMYDGLGSPLTQTFGLGVFQPITAAILDEIEAFYLDHDALVFHEVSPLIELESLHLLGSRGYRPVELTSVLIRSLNDIANLSPPQTSLEIGLIGKDAPTDIELWAQTATQGWSQDEQYRNIILELSRLTASKGSTPTFWALQNGLPIATGALSISSGVALLAGASTIPEYRRQGAQSALLYHRLKYAVEQGCELAMMCTLPGSRSQRNAERQGFRIAYTRIKWQLHR